MTFDQSFDVVSQLVKDFKAGSKHHQSSDYQERELRDDFINPFFIALGWDVLHVTQRNPYEQEVKIERTVEVSGAQKKADYSFSLAPNFRDPKFFVEAKNSYSALMNPDSYFQTVRYGWHKATPLAVLTNFFEFHILDCRYSPDINAILSRKVKAFHFNDYLDKEKFAEIFYLFSREAVASNSLEKFAEGLPKPKGKAVQKALFGYDKLKTIDDDFLNDIELKREILAKAFKRNDESLTSEELTEAVQKTIDRLVFIRFLEDKLIEQEHYVDKFGERNSAWADFIGLCKRLDAKYNGIVFKPSIIDHPKFPGADDKEFYSICQDMCHLNTRFLYNEIPIHILGSIYERFLGKVVHATDKRVKIEEKPEVRKAGGVYYTPKYIVDYIVKNTVGKLIEGKTPNEISKLKFADIACGSGSFLIGVFSELLQYHSTYYQDHPDKAKRDGCIFKDGKWVLSLRQKQNILINNIYGVDIDHQAVEVTQLSLALKLLEDETTATANEMQALFHEKIIPPKLTHNIVCGNSLINSDILNQDLFARSNEDSEERKLNAMDFENAFPAIMKAGGFNAIVGNPPYVLLQDRQRDIIALRYYKEKYNSAAYKVDLYHLFMERAISLLKNNGKLSYITPSNYLSNNGLVNLRKYILDNTTIDVINVINGQVFSASVDTCITILSKGINSNLSTYIKSEWQSNQLKPAIIKSFSQSNFYDNTALTFLATEKQELNVECFELGNEFNVNFGMQLRDRKKYLGDVIKNDDEDLKTKYHKPCYIGKDVQRYFTDYSGYLAYFNKKAKRGGCWDEEVHFSNPKVLIRQIGEHPICSMDERGYCCLNAMFMVTPIDADTVSISLYSLLGILNSNFVKHYWLNNFSDQRKTFPKIKGTYVEKLPIPIISKNNKNIYSKIENLVMQILNSKGKLTKSKSDKDKSFYQSKFSNADRQLNTLVNELYQLNDGEISLIDS